MRLVSWNIQWGRGIDGCVDLSRIVGEARRLADFDVLCLQEVTRGFDGPGGLPGGPSADQFAELAGLLPGFTVVEAIGSDLPPRTAPHGDRDSAGQRRRQFGNAIASRLPLGPVLRHSLPWPVDPAKPSMQRVALEAVVDTGAFSLRVITTHLEFYSETQRLAQVDALRQLHVQACAHAARPAPAENDTGPFANSARPTSALICGDFNSPYESSAYQRMLEPIANAPQLADAWGVAHAHEPRAATVGLYDHEQWPDGPLAYDFVFVTDDLVSRALRCDVDPDCAASDHQPVVLEMS